MHDLKELFDGFPEQIRNDISSSFAASTFPKPPITIYGLTAAKEQPLTPSGVPETRYDTAEGVIVHSADAFTKARYFFEDVKPAEWATIAHAVHYMVALSNVLDVVYDHYLEVGGWNKALAPHLRSRSTGYHPTIASVLSNSQAI